MQLFSLRPPEAYVVVAPYYGECCGAIHVAIARVYAYHETQAEEMIRASILRDFGFNDEAENPDCWEDAYGISFGEIAVLDPESLADLPVLGAPDALAAVARPGTLAAILS
jgi:hypothetical protein